jgi:hypothetical protein
MSNVILHGAILCNCNKVVTKKTESLLGHDTMQFTIFLKNRLPLPLGLSVSQVWEVYMDTRKWGIGAQINDRANKVKRAVKVH